MIATECPLLERYRAVAQPQYPSPPSTAILISSPPFSNLFAWVTLFRTVTLACETSDCSALAPELPLMSSGTGPSRFGPRRPAPMAVSRSVRGIRPNGNQSSSRIKFYPLDPPQCNPLEPAGGLYASIASLPHVPPCTCRYFTCRIGVHKMARGHNARK